MNCSVQVWRCFYGCDVSLIVKHRFRSGVKNTWQPPRYGPVMSLLREAPAVYGNWHRAVRLYVYSRPRMILSETSPNTDQQRKA